MCVFLHYPATHLHSGSQSKSCHGRGDVLVGEDDDEAGDGGDDDADEIEA